MPTGWHSVRVFLSSTFRDMHAERSYLVQNVFPRLRLILEPHRILVDEIDLRWGVSREQCEDDRTLEVCLEEIDHCRPFFVCLLGERYGCVPDRFREQLLASPAFAWLREQQGKSITELEILHAVLRDPAKRTRALFYFRKRDFLNQLPRTRRGDFVDDDPDSVTKLRQLKEAILACNPRPPMCDYSCDYAGLGINRYLARLELSNPDWQSLNQLAPDGVVGPDTYDALPASLRELVDRYSVVHLAGLEDFGDRLLGDLKEVILAECSSVAASSTATKEPLVEQQSYHQAFIESRHRVFVGRERILQQLLDCAGDDETVPCLVTGPAGSGKSALLARLAVEWSRRCPHDLVITHFLGASPQANDVRLLLLRFCGAVQQHFQLPDAEFADDLFVTQTFSKILTRIPPEGRVVFIVDGLNQFREVRATFSWQWLPESLPPNVKIILSGLTDDGPGPLPAALRSRRIRHWPIEPLTDTERRDILRRVPSLAAKVLDEDHVQMLVENPASASPLFLLTVLDEIRGLASSAEVTNYLRRLPRGGDPLNVIFTQVLERLELEYGPKLSADFFGGLAATRCGLPETDSLRLCQWLSGRSRRVDYAGYQIVDDDIRNALFSLLFRLRSHFYHLGRYVQFYHQSLAATAGRRYLGTAEDRRRVHLGLVDYFQHQQLNPQAPSWDQEWLDQRRALEIPWQLAEAGVWPELARLLADPRFLVSIWAEQEWDVRALWLRIEKHSSLRLLDAYRPLLERPQEYKLAELEVLAELLEWTRHRAEYDRLKEQIRAEYERRGEQPGMKKALCNLFRLGHDAIRREEFERTQHRAYAQENAGRRGLREKDWTTASAAFQEAEALFRRLGEEERAIFCVGGLAQALYHQGNWDGALLASHRHTLFSRECGQMEDLAESLGLQALIHLNREQLDLAEQVLEELESLWRGWGVPFFLQKGAGMRSMLLSKRGDQEGAVHSLREAERELQSQGDVEAALMLRPVQAILVASRLGRRQEAVKLLAEGAELAARAGLQALAQQMDQERQRLEAAGGLRWLLPTAGLICLAGGLLLCWVGGWAWLGAIPALLLGAVLLLLGLLAFSGAESAPCPKCAQPAFLISGRQWVCQRCGTWEVGSPAIPSRQPAPPEFKLPDLPPPTQAPALPQATAAPPEPSSGNSMRNDPCPCGSGKKFKNCCMRR